MSRSPILDSEMSMDDLSDEELLKRIAALDADEYPLAPVARRALERDSQEGSE